MSTTTHLTAEEKAAAAENAYLQKQYGKPGGNPGGLKWSTVVGLIIICLLAISILLSRFKKPELKATRPGEQKKLEHVVIQTDTVPILKYEKGHNHWPDTGTITLIISKVPNPPGGFGEEFADEDYLREKLDAYITYIKFLRTQGHLYDEEELRIVNRTVLTEMAEIAQDLKLNLPQIFFEAFGENFEVYAVISRARLGSNMIPVSFIIIPPEQEPLTFIYAHLRRASLVFAAYFRLTLYSETRLSVDYEFNSRTTNEQRELYVKTVESFFKRKGLFDNDPKRHSEN